jgi:hypothetical protein
MEAFLRIYQSEKEDGVDAQMSADKSSVAFVTAPVNIGDIKKYFDGMSMEDIIKATSTIQTVEELLGQVQPDLALVVAILVSTGWNDNDDIFTPAEVWKARSTPLHKPMNDNHQAEKILGHIVQTRVLDKSGEEIVVAEGGSPPDEFDIEVAGVLYRAFDVLSDRIEEIITKAQNGEMFVSMEAWFPDFGYGLTNTSTGKTNLIDRTESTAFLTKHLRIYGGSGEYQGYKVGRVLKDIIFGAQGFTENPANPESVIKVAASRGAASKVFVTAELNGLLEGGVEDMDKDQLKELQVQLDEAKASLESKTQEVSELQKAADDFKAKDYDGQITTLNTKLEEMTVDADKATETMKVISGQKNELQKQLDEVTNRADKSEAELEVIRKNEVARDRFAQLSEVKQIDDKDATLAELCSMSDETFALVLKFAGDTDKSDNKESEKTEAALDDVKTDDSADFIADASSAETAKESWRTLANVLTGHETKKDEGGE